MNENTNHSVRFLAFVSQSITFETGGDKAGGHTNDPDDKGGETKWGISKRSHPELNIKTLTFQQAQEVYYKRYYNVMYDYISDNAIAFKLFDMGILTGTNKAVKLLQKEIVKNGYLIRIDGIFGPLTLTALNLCKGPLTYERYVTRYNKYFKLISLKWNNKKYLKGWLNRLDWKWQIRKEG